MRERSVALCIVLTIVTCGIYGLYWMVCLANDVNTISGGNKVSGGMVLLLTIITCGIYGFYWLYVSGVAIDEYKRSYDYSATNYSGILYIAFALFGLSIISYALMQDEINKVACGRYISNGQN